MIATGDALPLVLAGPMLRLSSPQQLVIWLAVREPVRVRITIDPGEGLLIERVATPGQEGCRGLVAGAHLHYLLIDLRFELPLPRDRWISYSVHLQSLAAPDGCWLRCAGLAPDLCYPGKTSPGFVLPSRVGSLLHGSCRKRNYALIEVLFGGVGKPVFTTDSAHNHLITLGEVLAMYLLVWF